MPFPLLANVIINTLHLKKVVHQVMWMTLSFLNGFSQFFHWHIMQKICDKIITKDPTTPKTCRYTTLQNLYIKK